MVEFRSHQRGFNHAESYLPFEIGCRDRSKTSHFYGQLFDWKMEDAGPATMIGTGDGVAGHISGWT